MCVLFPFVHYPCGKRYSPSISRLVFEVFAVDIKHTENRLLLTKRKGSQVRVSRVHLCMKYFLTTRQIHVVRLSIMEGGKIGRWIPVSAQKHYLKKGLEPNPEWSEYI